MSKLVATLSFCLLGVYSAPCIPANTCFPVNVGDSSSVLDIAGDKSVMWTCDKDGKVVSNFWTNIEKGTANKGFCDRVGTSSFSQETENEDGSTGFDAGTVHKGMTTDGSSSGAISTDYLQGLGCPGLGSSSNTCSEYFVVKRYGDSSWISPVNQDELDFQDVGRGAEDIYDDANGLCQGKETGDWAEANFFVIPYGCINFPVTGSMDYYISKDADGDTYWGYQFYLGDDCTGDQKTAQSDEWIVGECGIFSERTHCGNQNSVNSPTICSTDGVLVEYDYWYDLICAPAAVAPDGVPTCVEYYGSGTSQSGAPTPSPTDGDTNATQDPNCPVCPGLPCCDSTPSPVSTGATPSPDAGSTPSPDAGSTPSPNSSGSTPSPNSSGQTPSPNSQGPSGPSGPSGTGAPTEASAVRMQFIMTVIIGSILALIM